MEIDGKAWKMLAALQANARLSLTELAQVAGLSVPAVSERLRRLEEAGVIRGYRAEVAADKLGYPLQALIGITVPQPYKATLLALLDEMPEVLECHHVTGQDSYVFRLACRDVAHLEATLARVNHLGETRTALILSTPIPIRPLQPFALRAD